MYVLDTSAFSTLGFYYPSRFPTVWRKVDALVRAGGLTSVREVLRELMANCRHPHVTNWAKANRRIFKVPDSQEQAFVLELLKDPQHQNLVKLQHILKGRPVADPFVIAAGATRGAIVVTQEADTGGARIPTICGRLGVWCINVEGFLKREGVRY